jgi:hypothetical protein
VARLVSTCANDVLAILRSDRRHAWGELSKVVVATGEAVVHGQQMTKSIRNREAPVAEPQLE